jgi:hypothetical protein
MAVHLEMLCNTAPFSLWRASPARPIKEAVETSCRFPQQAWPTLSQQTLQQQIMLLVG